MAYITGHSLDGAMVAIDLDLISMIKEVPTKQVMGEELWKAQTEKWRKSNPVVTIVTTRQTPNQTETYFPVPIVNVMWAINQGKASTNSDGFMMVETNQCYDTNELQALMEGDLDEIKEKELFLPCHLQAGG